MVNDTESLVRRVEQVEVRRAVRISEGLKKLAARAYTPNYQPPQKHLDYKA